MQFNLGKLNIIEVWFKKETSVTTITEVLVCPRLLWIIFVALALVNRRLGRCDDITSSLRNLIARVLLHDNLVIPCHHRGYFFLCQTEWNKSFQDGLIFVWGIVLCGCSGI